MATENLIFISSLHGRNPTVSEQSRVANKAPFKKLKIHSGDQLAYFVVSMVCGYPNIRMTLINSLFADPAHFWHSPAYEVKLVESSTSVCPFK